MILKKPYAFLIKYFKLIHFFIGAILVFVAYKYFQIYNFFKDYIKNNYKTSVILSLDKTYTPVFLFLSVFIVFSLVLAILILLRKKQKPHRLYIFMAIYYIVLFISLFYLSFVFKSFEIELLGSTLSRSIRDILLICLFPQFIFIFFSIIRFIGFNLKDFNFQNDIKQLTELTDNEEVEININFDANSLKKKTHRTYRELIYYIKENKFILSIVAGVILLIIGYFLISSRKTNYNQSYSLGKSFMYNKVRVTINDAILSPFSYNGKTVEKGYDFLALDVNVKNDTGKSVLIDYNNFKLLIGKNTYTPERLYSSYFLDFSPKDLPNSISSQYNKNFSIVYKIPEKESGKSKKISIFNGTVYDKDDYVSKYINIKINEKHYDALIIEDKYRINDAISFRKTFLKNSSLKINSYEFSKQYLYLVEDCEEEKCTTYKDILTIPAIGNRSKNTLLIMNCDFKEDLTSNYARSFTSLKGFANNFMSIEYKINDKTISKTINEVTPDNLNNYMIVEVPNEIVEASEINLIINIRNRRYIVNLLG